MNSERIRRRFGSYGLEIVECGNSGRLTSLYSVHGGRRICRTFARVAFCLPMADDLAAEHRRVLSGESIGSVFKEAGWKLVKRHVRIGETPLTQVEADIAERMHLDLPCALATHSYVFEVAKGGVRHAYAEITELHHPGYLGVGELRLLFADASAARRAADARG